jgi:hypothetical protein
MLPDLSKISEVAGTLKSLAASMEKVAGVAVKIDALIETAGGVEGIKEKILFFEQLRAMSTPSTTPPPEQDA